MMERNNDSGFTLVEVMISMAIFAIGVLAIINMQIMSTWTNARARGITDGVVVAQNLMERLSSLSTGSADLQDTNLDGAAGLDNRTAASADHSDLTNVDYQLFWNVQDDFPFPDTKFIRVYVVWDDREQTKWFSLDMLVSP